MTPEQHALSQMRITNMIKDSDYMEYIIPVDGTKFIINRYDTKYSSIGTEYLITTKVVNNLGTTLTEFRMSETDLLIILDNIDQFITSMSYDDEMPLYTNPSQGNMNNNMIKLTRKNVEAMYPENIIDPYTKDTIFPDHKLNIASKPKCIPEYLIDNKYEDIRDILFEIYQYSPYHQNMVPIYSAYISESELHDLVFAYFFVGLIDIPLTEGGNETIERMFSNGTL